MKMINILDKISLELKELSKNPENIKNYSKFYKDGKKHISLTTPLVKKVALKNFKQVRNLEKKKILSLCERLLKTNRAVIRISHLIGSSELGSNIRKRILKFLKAGSKTMWILGVVVMIYARTLLENLYINFRNFCRK